jgi:hypothetical protein
VITTVALFEQERLPGYGLRSAIRQAGLSIVDLTEDPASAADAARPGTAFRGPAGLLAQAMTLGAVISLATPTVSWFTGLPTQVTGRRWVACGPPVARALIAQQSTFVKLAGAKHPRFPARPFSSLIEFDAAVQAVGGDDDLQLLATTTWLSIESEYRTFTLDREVVTCSPYRIHDEPWTPLLRTHRASFHQEAWDWTRGLLNGLARADVPPAAVLDIARLSSGDFILLEANKPWAAGLYGCEPGEALRSVLAANAITAGSAWLWQPDPHLSYTS